MKIIKGFFKFIYEFALFTIVIVVMLLLSLISLTYTNIFGETCGYIHPVIFQVDSSVIYQDTNLKFASDADPHIPFDVELDTLLRVYDSQGTLIAVNDDLDEVAGGSGILGLDITDYSEVIIEVSSYGDYFSGEYMLTVQSADDINEDIDDLDYEFDFVPEVFDAESIAINGTVQGIVPPDIRYRHVVDVSQANNPAIDIELTGLYNDGNEAINWPSCVDYYGYVDGRNFILNDDGLFQFVDEEPCEACTITTLVNLTFTGQVWLYILLPGMVILLPIAGAYVIRDFKNRITPIIAWSIMLICVALLVLTSSVMYIHLATVSGIDALANFAYGILGGAATGSAIAFMTKVLEIFSDDGNESESSEPDPIDKARAVELLKELLNELDREDKAKSQ